MHFHFANYTTHVDDCEGEHRTDTTRVDDCEGEHRTDTTHVDDCEGEHRTDTTQIVVWCLKKLNGELVTWRRECRGQLP